MFTNPRTLELRLEMIVSTLAALLENADPVIGISGGIDSAVVAALLCRAVGFDRVRALALRYNELLNLKIIDKSGYVLHINKA